MPIYVYAETKNDAAFIAILDNQVPDPISAVEVAELNLVAIEVAATSKDILDEVMATKGFTFLHTATVNIDGNKHWGSFTTANEPAADVVTGDTGFDTTKGGPVYYTGAAWVLYSTPVVSDLSSVQIPATLGTAKFNWLDEGGAEVAALELQDANFRLALNTSAATPNLFLNPQTLTIALANTVANTIWSGGTNSGDGVAIVRWLSVGTGGANIGAFYGDRSPVGLSFGLRGDTYTSSNDNMYVLAGNGTLSPADWHNISFKNVNTESADLTPIPNSYNYIRLDTTATTFAVQLPPAADLPQGKELTFKVVGVGSGNYVDIIFSVGSNNIDGSGSDRRISGLNDVFSLIRVGTTDYEITNDTRNIAGAISHTGGETSQAGIGTTPVIITAFNNNLASYNGIISADQANNFVTIDHVEDTTNGDSYVVLFNISFEFASGNILTLEVYYNGVATGIKAENKGLGTSSDQLTTTAYGIVSVTTAADFEIRASNNLGTDTAEWYDGSFVIRKSR